MLILGAVILVVVIAAIIAAVFVIRAAKKTSGDNGKHEAISLEDFLQGRTATRSFNGTWITGTF